MTPSRIDYLTDEIRHTERRLRTIAMSEADHKRGSDYLAELHAQRWCAIMEWKMTARELSKQAEDVTHAA